MALKVIAADRAVDPDFRERFRREARSAAALDHPGVITIYEAGLVEDLPYMTMRLVRGPDLGRQLRIGGPLEPEVAAGVVAMVADALETAHESGLVHRDIKPANILLERRGRELRALLADFGLARLAELIGAHDHGQLARDGRLRRARDARGRARQRRPPTSTPSAPCCTPRSPGGRRSRARRPPP